MRWAVLSLGLLPALWLPVAYATDGLGANPIEALQHRTGLWTLRLLLLTLAVTPLRRLLGWTWLAPERRTLGLLAFFYGCIHFAVYLGLDLFFDFGVLAEDVAERAYITVGFAALVLLTPLALTSTRASMRRIGPYRWRRLHALVYPAAIAGVVHFLWLTKADLRDPALYGAAICILLALRAWWQRNAIAAAATRLPRAPGRAKLPDP